MWLYGTRTNHLSKSQIQSIVKYYLTPEGEARKGSSVPYLDYVLVDNTVTLAGFSKFADRRIYIGVIGAIAGWYLMATGIGPALAGIGLAGKFAFFTLGSYLSSWITVALLYFPKEV